MTAAKRFPDRDDVASVRAETESVDAGGQAGSTRRLAGRVMARREMGKLVFLDLVDRSGRIQLICDSGVIGDVEVHLGDVVGVVGKPAKSRRGEPSLAVDELTVLAKNHSPLPDTFHGLTDQETRYRKRYLDLLMNQDSRDLTLLRTRIVTAIRRYLDEEGFVEVETPILQPRYGGAFAHPFVTRSTELESDLYLRIATELYLKRLIVGGLERVYEIGKDFRNESVSYKHQPEFTMLEWYEAFADYCDTMERIETMLERVALEVLGTTRVTFRGHEIALEAPWRRVLFVDALEHLELWTRDADELRARLHERGVDTSADKDWTQLVDHAFGHFVEPSLTEPTIVHDYPVELSPFARTTDDEALTERFEYFAAGMELGNAYSEINDPREQQQRFDEQSEHVEGVRGDPDYVEALAYGMPPTGGLGLGIDRLTMLLSGRETIRDVILFPALRPER
ncbi:MAG TPA: lysine--tRNA ligase [Gaiellaceae bacterium]|nr:lysine--tRNA ligase [Gaiellaceae bacterium]